MPEVTIMKTFVIKTATALTLGAGLAVSGLAAAENWTTHVGQVRADLPTQSIASSGVGSGENYQHFVGHVRANGPRELSPGEVLVSENYVPHIEAVRNKARFDQVAADELRGKREQAQRDTRHGIQRPIGGGREGFR
ncbi:hypothetical protein Mlg_1051 [Alkalilimnicola ehrlichii MLHE-1]|uniref:DUF4148 domain-containing protein n=2 Tax=Alkalilimnicola ehrlichii TaxID=351052 RepID=Q0A9T3_ALKEH|nr:hypothetical protein Mlg_1051 [Alkalilimnicola ehrlichii MLHE-1]